MRLKTRIREIETKLGPKEDYPLLIIVFDDGDGAWHDGHGTEIDPQTVDPRTRVFVLRKRPDGPQ